MFDYTVIGGNGFIGNEVASLLKSKGFSVFLPKRNDASVFIKSLGIVIYCAGNGDCEKKPFEVLESNTVLLSNILIKSTFEKLFYLSSTRLYMDLDDAHEDSSLKLLADDNRRLFNITKLAAEELCLLTSKNSIVLRVANVYGLALNSPLFLPSIIRNAITDNEVNMYVTKKYAKDYVSVKDVAEVIYQLSAKKILKHNIYNVGSGKNTPTAEIATILEAETKCMIKWNPSRVDDVFPINDISRLQLEIDYVPSNVLNDLKLMINEFKSSIKI